MKDLKVEVQKNGSGLRFYLNTVLQAILNVKEGDKFQVEMKTVKGVKKIIFTEIKE